MDRPTVGEGLAALQDEVMFQLHEGGGFFTTIIAARARIAHAKEDGDEREAARAAAAYGGVVKRWRRYLIINLTQIAFGPDEASRVFVRAWQKRVFGQAVASRTLSTFSKRERSGGGRAENPAPGEATEARLARFYEHNRERVKECKKSP